MRLFLVGVFTPEIMKQFYLVGFNPQMHNVGAFNKNYHLSRIAHHYGISLDRASLIVLFDAHMKSIDSALDTNVRAFPVNRQFGFMLNDLLCKQPSGATGDDEDSEEDDDVAANQIAEQLPQSSKDDEDSEEES